MRGNVTDRVLAELGKNFHQTSVEHGWWEDGDRNFGELMALLHSEISEALEEWRNGHKLTEVYYNEYGGGQHPYKLDGHIQADDERKILKPEGIPVEFADVIIRLLETCYHYGIDIDAVVQLKAEYNKTRPYRHGKKKA